METNTKSKLQDWVNELGSRHVGVLLSAVRGCDTAPKNDPSKNMTRVFRGHVLTAHGGDVKASKTFMEWVTHEEFTKRADALLYSLDQYPFHFVMHFVHAAEVIGYYHPIESIRRLWHQFYTDAVYKMHMHHETKEELDKRLNANEETFVRQQMTPSEMIKQTEKELAAAAKKKAFDEAAFRGGT